MCATVQPQLVIRRKAKHARLSMHLTHLVAKSAIQHSPSSYEFQTKRCDFVFNSGSAHDGDATLPVATQFNLNESTNRPHMPNPPRRTTA
jgi:hypothetical protein